MRYTGPKNKLSRREGIDLGLKSTGSKAQSNLLKKIGIVPGQHGKSRRSKTTDYGNQLREKQKLRRMYGLTEHQLKLYFLKAIKKIGNTSEHLIIQLERRLDNVIYKLGIAPTRASARQLVTHGHILVNDKKINIPSYLIDKNDIISFKKETSTKIPYVAELLEKKDAVHVSWLERSGTKGKVIGVPELQDFIEEINLQYVVEYYSR